VPAHQLPDVPGAESPEEPAQRGLIGEAPQPPNLREGALVLADLGGIDAVEPHHDREEPREPQLGRRVVAGPEGGSEPALEEPLQAELLTERLDQGHPGDVRPVQLFEADRHISPASCPVTQSTPRVRSGPRRKGSP